MQRDFGRGCLEGNALGCADDRHCYSDRRRVLALVAPGEEPNRCSDLGTTLIGGAVVAVAVLYLERQFSHGAEKRDLLQLGLQTSLVSIDLRDRDLSGFHLAGKDLRGANLTGANLKGANLSGTDLTNATLNGADLRGAKVDKTPLYPSATLHPSTGLKPAPIYPDAITQNAWFDKAKHDAGRRWPSHIDLDKIGAI